MLRRTNTDKKRRLAVTTPPAPGLADDLHYEQMVRRVVHHYDFRFKAVQAVRPACIPPLVARRMSRRRRSDTGPELALRGRLHAMGCRYRLLVPVGGTRRTSDIAFPVERVAVDVRGSFWHTCPDHGTAPTSNRDWWADKLDRNKERDLETTALLKAARCREAYGRAAPRLGWHDANFAGPTSHWLR